MAPAAVQKRLKNVKKQTTKTQPKKIAKIVEQSSKESDEKVAEKKVQVEEEEDSPMEDVSETEAEMDSDVEKEEKMEDSDSDLPSDFEREMAVSDEEEEDEEDEEETPDKLNKDIDQHKKELEELKERDPEFYDYLQKEDGDLLGFGESDDGEEEEEDMDEQEEFSDMEEPEEKMMDDIPVLTKSTLNEWIDAIKSNNDFKTFKKLLSAFKTASRMSEEDDKITFTLKIEDPSVFSKVITSTLRLAPIVFGHHLKPKRENGSPMTSN
ncbi:hypothetical protein BD770DRAFT_449602, partial [Pilaira anomala]